MQLQGGASWFRRISFSSNNHKAISTAKAVKNGEWIIQAHIKERNVVYKRLSKLESWPIPRLIYLFIFVFSIASWFVRLVTLVVVALIVYMVFSPSINSPIVTPVTFWSTYLHYIIKCLLIVSLLGITKIVSPWHGAEHMAIASYLNNGSTRIEDMQQHSPIDKDCGTKFYIAIVLVLQVSKLIPDSIGLPSWIINFVLIEATLWIDKFIGLSKIPGVSHLTILFQKMMHTRPRDHHLATAKCALDALIKADGP